MYDVDWIIRLVSIFWIDFLVSMRIFVFFLYVLLLQCPRYTFCNRTLTIYGKLETMASTLSIRNLFPVWWQPFPCQVILVCLNYDIWSFYLFSLTGYTICCISHSKFNFSSDENSHADSLVVWRVKVPFFSLPFS